MTLTLSGQVLDDISCRQVLDNIYFKSPSTKWHLLQVAQY